MIPSKNSEPADETSPERTESATPSVEDSARVIEIDPTSGQDGVVKAASFGPSGPPTRDYPIRDSFDIGRQTISKNELTEIIALACRGDRNAYNRFFWNDFSATFTPGNPVEQLNEFFNIEALDSFGGIYDYADGSRFFVNLDRVSQIVRFEAKDYNSEAERRMHEIRAATLDWGGRRIVPRSRMSRVLRVVATYGSLSLVGLALLFFVAAQGFEPSTGALIGSGLVWGVGSGLAATWAGQAGTVSIRQFTLKHPENRSWNHDKVQSWGVIIGIAVAVILGILGLVL